MTDTDPTRDELTRLRALAKVGKGMREAQRRYFKTRSREVLIASKDLEAAFDLLLDECLNANLFSPPARSVDAPRPVP